MVSCETIEHALSKQEPLTENQVDSIVSLFFDWIKCIMDKENAKFLLLSNHNSYLVQI